jgi:hypothetical protein
LKVDHAQVSGACEICHQKPVTHMVSSSHCEDCHIQAVSWSEVVPVDYGLTSKPSSVSKKPPTLH